MGGQLLSGEDVGDAAVKTVAHTAITLGIAALGVVGWPALLAGFAVSTAFDLVYDNWDTITKAGSEIVDSVVEEAQNLYHDGKEFVDNTVETAQKTVKDVGDAVSGWFNNIGSAFG